MYNVQLIAKSGEKWLYSDARHYILAEAIAKLSGKLSDMTWATIVVE